MAHGSPPIRTLAIASRGEAALRCLRTVRTLRRRERRRLEAVVFYTEPDRDAPFVRHADRAVELAAERGREASAYLDPDRLVEAVQAAGAEALWPGWGFLAEDPRLAEACEKAGLRFLGPPPAVLRALGDKLAAKRLARTVGARLAPWAALRAEGEGALGEALRKAARLGYPLLVKAVAGGGGRGIREVAGPEELAAALEAARAEALAAFGDGRLLLERQLEGVRHIEVQLAADASGRVLALGLRDCSVQRRRQKLVEEAPPVRLGRRVRRELAAVARRIAQSVGLVGIATVEFLVKGSEAYFLEVNPRLQVEHGVTEAVTGLDLVELQLRIAEGGSLPARAPAERGFAIEARVCAEEPEAGFAPAAGRVLRFDPPLGPGVRVDSGIAPGSTVPDAFDSLLAKVIAHGANREQARARLVAALEELELVIERGASNRGLLLELLESDGLRRGGIDTSWLERELARRRRRPYRTEALVAAAILTYQRERQLARERFFADPSRLLLAQIPPSRGRTVELHAGGHSYRPTVYAIGAWRYRVDLDGRSVRARLREEGRHGARLAVGGRELRVLFDRSELGLRIEVEGTAHRFGSDELGAVRAPAPAMVVAVRVRPGERVVAGSELLVLEAMKSELVVSAPLSGHVTRVRVQAGQRVGAGELLLSIASPEAADGAAEAEERVRLPEEADPLDLLFGMEDTPRRGPAGLTALGALASGPRRALLEALREEIRRLLLGYDVNPERAERLAAFLEAPLGVGFDPALLEDLASLGEEIVTFADVEQLFIRAPRASVSGEKGPSNYARLRTFVRRLGSAGAGIAREFLALVERALRHYGVESLERCDALERAVLRLLATRHERELRHRLVMALLRRTVALTRAGVTLGAEPRLADALDRIAAMRGLLPDALADAAIEARDEIFEAPKLARDAERTAKRLELGLAQVPKAAAAVAPERVLLELACAPWAVFRRAAALLADPAPERYRIGLAAYLYRLHLPEPGSARAAPLGGGVGLELRDGRLLLAVRARAERVEEALEELLGMGASAAGLAGLELFVASAPEAARARIRARVEQAFRAKRLPARLTLAFFDPADPDPDRERFLSWEPGPSGLPRELDRHGLHPAVARRIDFGRLASFELERLAGGEDLYCFFGRHREAPDDERLFVLADVRGRSFDVGREATLHVPAFERAFHAATRRLRALLGLRDPRRRLQWNRIVLSVAPPIVLEPEVVQGLAQRLAPATRHLGLEKVIVRLRLLEREAHERPPRGAEIVISDPTGSQMEIAWRRPRRAPLRAASELERRIAAARRRGLLHPYELVKLLTGSGHGGGELGPGAPRRLPRGRFEEWDLEPGSRPPRARSVAGRPYGHHRSSVVFGILTTPTAKVPEGLRRVLILSDPTREMGALGPEECDRIVAAIDLAERLGLPVEWVPVSSGARISMESGTENLDATARVARRIVRFTRAGGVIHVIVYGINVGAQSYFDALATMGMETRGALVMTPGGSMVLTGRAALEASGSVSAEDEAEIGGYERVMGPNGEAQYFAHDLVDAFALLQEHYRYTYVVPGEPGPRRFPTADPPDRDITQAPYREEDGLGFARVGDIFDPEANPGRKRPFSMRALMAALVDQDGGWLERWRAWAGAETAIVWDAHLGGHPVCLIGIESKSLEREGYRPPDGPAVWTGGTLFPLSSKKVARAIRAASGNRPVVVLANLSGFDGSPESMRRLQLEYGAEIARAVVEFRGPIVFLVVSRYHGGAYVVFSRALNPGLRALAVEGSYASVIGGAPAAAVVFAREVRARAASDPRVLAARERLPHGRELYERLFESARLEAQARLAAEFDAVHTVERALAVGSLEALVPAPRIRPSLIALLDGARDAANAAGGAAGAPSATEEGG